MVHLEFYKSNEYHIVKYGSARFFQNRFILTEKIQKFGKFQIN